MIDCYVQVGGVHFTMNGGIVKTSLNKLDTYYEYTTVLSKCKLTTMKTIKLLCFIALLLFSCSTQEIPKEQIIIENETPAVLENNARSIDIGSISKRYENDIIHELYNEAVNKDNDLKLLLDKIEKIDEVRDDSLKCYATYFNTNEKYWKVLDLYIERIKDTILRNEIKETFTVLESNYDKKILPLKQMESVLEQRVKKLEDYKIVLQLIVTKQMITNYQVNELPGKEKFSNEINNCDTLVDNIKKYIKQK